jgi:hypothetical protein
LRQVIQQPAPAAIIGSLRSIGYSFNTAIADLIDNSISASATAVFICLESVEGKPLLSVLDDGCGLEKADLIEAMRHGGAGVAHKRSKDDLGRYGLGLKTASLSQCRRLTVASIGPSGLMSVARWDLNQIEQQNDWVLLLPSKSSLSKISAVRALAKAGRGTVIIWEEFDLALSGATKELDALENLLDDARPHLAVVFQRFLKGGDAANEITLSINGVELSAIDPFLSLNPKTQRLPTEEVKVGSARARITAFILPQLKNMSDTELASLGGPTGIRQGQGFYVYRNKRLIIAGTWFRMLRLDELTKLARVQIDIPNTMDDLWNLDVKKSTATPPEPVRQALKRIVDRIAARSFNAFRDRRPRKRTLPIIPVWIRSSNGNLVSYRLNREHPIIAEILDDGGRGKSARDHALRLIEISLPYLMIFADMSSNAVAEPTKSDIELTLRELLGEWMARCAGDVDLKKSIIGALPSLEPFAAQPELTKALAEEYDRGA